MKSLLHLFIAILLIFSISAYAQIKKETHTMKGYLIDKMCGSGMAKKAPDQAMASAAKHTKDCAMEEGCAASGYGLMMDGTWAAFDEAGSKKAAEYLKKTKAKDHLYIAVSGTMEGEMIKVSSIKSAKEKMN
jgi:hypothetical protein